MITEHHGHHPEITFTSDTTAEGTWYLQDRVIVPAADLEIGGTAFYADRYRLTDDGWRIAHTGYTRVFEEHRTHSSLEVRLFTSRFDGGLRRLRGARRAEGEGGVEQRRRRQGLLNRIDEVGLELEVERLDVLPDLLGTAGPDDGAADVLVAQDPGQRDGRRRVAGLTAQCGVVRHGLEDLVAQQPAHLLALGPLGPRARPAGRTRRAGTCR